MPDIVIDNKVRVAWVPTITVIASPTVAQLNAGLLISPFMPKDGLQGLGAETAAVDTSGIEGKFNTSRPGRINYSGAKIRLKKQTSSDTAYTTLVYEAEGFLVVRRYILFSVAWTAAQEVEVYPAVCGEPVPVDFEENTLARYDIPLMITAQPNLRAVVAA